MTQFCNLIKMRYCRPCSLSTYCYLLSVVLLIFVSAMLLAFIFDNEGVKQDSRQNEAEQALRTHFAIVNKYLEDRQNWQTSILGSWLFKFDTRIEPRNTTFLVYFTKYKSPRHKILEECSVKNCIFTGDDKQLPIADAVLVPIQHGIIPKVENRKPEQRWIFMNDESPYHAFRNKRLQLKDIVNIFNWSMTYRIEADIPRLYGRTAPLDEPVFKYFDTSAITEIIPNWQKKRRDVLISILMSNCAFKYRMKFIKRLKKYLPVDLFGSCASNKSHKHICPGHFRKDCGILSKYLFYLALENSDCRDYLTEKIWYNAYSKGAIPIIIGPSLSDCKRLLPPNSYIHLPMNYTDGQFYYLVRRLRKLSEDDNELLSLHQWRNHFAAINEHGYFGLKSLLLCRVCEGLNYNDAGPKIFGEAEIRWFLDPSVTCGKNNV